MLKEKKGISLTIIYHLIESGRARPFNPVGGGSHALCLYLLVPQNKRCSQQRRSNVCKHWSWSDWWPHSRVHILPCPTETHTDGNCPSEPVSLGTHTKLNSEHLLKHLSVHSLHNHTVSHSVALNSAYLPVATQAPPKHPSSSLTAIQFHLDNPIEQFATAKQNMVSSFSNAL